MPSSRSRNGDGSPHLTTPRKDVVNRLPAEQPTRAEIVRITRIKEETPADDRAPLAMFCFEALQSPIGQQAARTAAALARRGLAVHLFARHAFEIPGVRVRAVGESEGELTAQARTFGERACDAFVEQFQNGTRPQALLGYEWSAVPALATLRDVFDLDMLLSLHSLERQRSDLSSQLSQEIEQLELQGLRQARTVLVQQPATGEVAKYWAPESAERLVNARQPFPVHQFPTLADPGQVKARYQVGPVDPLIVFVGDLEERYGPQFLVKAMPGILKNNQQVRLALVGDGSQHWPLRVYARYLLLEHSIRFVGSLEGQPLFDLIAAADVVAVPSMEQTPWWPILAGWAAKRPVVATHAAAPGLVEHEKDTVLCYPSENSLVWGVERILYDATLAQCVARQGHARLEERYGWNCVAEQIEGLLPSRAAR